MAMYSGTRSGMTPNTSNDNLTLTPASTRMVRFVEVFLGGEATSSTVNRTAISRTTTVGVTPTAQTPEQMNLSSVAAVSTLATNWTTQPVIATTPILIFAYNAFGGVVRWVAAPGQEIFLLSTSTLGQLSNRNGSGTGVISLHEVWEEM